MGQAVIIEGKSYLPVRSVAEGMNLKVDVQSKTINLTNGGLSEEDRIALEESSKRAQEEQERFNEEAEKINKINGVKNKIKSLQDYIVGKEYQLSEAEAEAVKLLETMGETAALNSPLYKDAEDRIALFKKQISELQDQIKQHEAELAELEK